MTSSSALQFPIVINDRKVPHVGKKIFQRIGQMVDVKSLFKLRLVCKTFQEGIDSYSGLWDKISLVDAITWNETPRPDIVSLIVKHAKKKNRWDWGEDIEISPLHSAAIEGCTDIFKMIMQTVEDINPADKNMERHPCTMLLEGITPRL